MSKSIKILRAEISDFEEILKIQKLAFRSEAEKYCNFNIYPMIQTYREMLEECTSKVVLKATENAIIIGSVRAEIANKTCHINKLIVHCTPQFSE